MRKIVIISSTVLSLVFGIAATGYAQQGAKKEKQDQPSQQQQAKHQGKPEQQHGEQQKQDNQQQQARQEEQHVQQRQNQDKQHQQQLPQHSQEQRRIEQSTWQDNRARSWESDHQTWEQRGGYEGYRVPFDRYYVYFGQQHWFRIYGRPFMASGGYPRFQYEGYWITILDPWPEYWSDNWYENDDVYIDYSKDGYYMHNRRYPQNAIAISISM